MPIFTFRRSALALFLAGFGCGCGGSGGGGASTPGVPLGSRELPGATVSTRALAPLTPGTTVRFAVAVAGEAPVSALAADIGTSWASTTPAEVRSMGPQEWTVSVALPDPVPPDLGLLLHVTFADGAIVETWVADHPLASGD